MPARLILGLALAVLGGCASTPTGDPVAAIRLAEARLETGDAVGAAELLESIDEESVTGENLERLLLRKAQAWARTGSHWAAFKVIRDFSEKHPFSPYITQAQDLEFEIGSYLIRSTGGFLFFTSDARDGQTVLEHFALRYAKNPATPDALRLLGEKAYADGDYLLASQRFRDLILQHENSEWVPLARFRVAMSAFRVLSGPAYDLQSMSTAHRELRDFLANPVENPAFRAEAAEALGTVREWLGQKHMQIVDFYDRVGNSKGAALHLDIAARDFPETEAGRHAAERLERQAAAGGSP